MQAKKRFCQRWPARPDPRVILRVTPVDPVEEHSQRVVAIRHGDEMNMVGHEAPSQEADTGAGQVFSQEMNIGGTVLVGREGLAAVDAALGDMASHVGEHASVAAGHSAERSGKRRADLSEK